MKAHLIYIASILVLSTLLFIKYKETDTSGKYIAYLTPNDPQVHIVPGYQPDLEYRELNGITYPFLKGTDHLLVYLRREDGYQSQWIIKPRKVDIPYEHKFEEVERLDLLPEEYRKSLFGHSSVHPEGKNRKGEVAIMALFPRKSEFYRTTLYGERKIDFAKF